MASHFSYYPYKEAQPICNFADIPLYHGQGLSHAVTNGWCRFTYTKHNLSFWRQNDAKILILIAIMDTFEDLERQPQMDMFRSKGKWYVDLEMVNISADEWKDTLQ